MLAAVVAAAAAAVADNCPDNSIVKTYPVTSKSPAFSQCVLLPELRDPYFFEANKKVTEQLLCSAATKELPCCASTFDAGYGTIECYATFTSSSDKYVDLFQKLKDSKVTCSNSISSGAINEVLYNAVRCSAADSTDAPTGDSTDATGATDATDSTDAPATGAPPPPSPSPSPDGGDDSGSGMSTGEIVGISFGAVVGVVLAGTAIAAA